MLCFIDHLPNGLKLPDRTDLGGRSESTSSPLCEVGLMRQKCLGKVEYESHLPRRGSVVETPTEKRMLSMLISVICNLKR